MGSGGNYGCSQKTVDRVMLDFPSNYSRRLCINPSRDSEYFCH